MAYFSERKKKQVKVGRFYLKNKLHTLKNVLFKINPMDILLGLETLFHVKASNF